MDSIETKKEFVHDLIFCLIRYFQESSRYPGSFRTGKRFEAKKLSGDGHLVDLFNAKIDLVNEFFAKSQGRDMFKPDASIFNDLIEQLFKIINVEYVTEEKWQYPFDYEDDLTNAVIDKTHDKQFNCEGEIQSIESIDFCVDGEPIKTLDNLIDLYFEPVGLDGNDYDDFTQDQKDDYDKLVDRFKKSLKARVKLRNDRYPKPVKIAPKRVPLKKAPRKQTKKARKPSE